MKKKMRIIGEKMRAIGSVIAVATCYTIAEAATQYAYENDQKTYVVTVTESNDDISTDAINVLNSNAVTNFVKRGDKRFQLSNGEGNAFTGDVTIEDGSILVSRQNPLGPSGQITVNSKKAIVFSEVTLAKDVRLAGGEWDGGDTKISVWAGASRLNGKFILGKHIDGKAYDVGVVSYEGSVLTFAGGMADEDSSKGAWLTFKPSGGGTVVFENKPINIAKSFIIMPDTSRPAAKDGYCGRFVFSVAGNKMANLGLDDGSSDRRMNWCDLKTTVDYAFDVNSKVYIGHDTRWDLCGTSQRIKQLDVKVKSGNPSVITNSLQTPATLYAAMMYGNNGAPNIRIGGNLSVVYEGNIWDMKINNAMTATGDLVINSKGTLTFEANGSWVNAANVAVNNGEGKIVINNPNALGRMTNVSLAYDSSLQIKAGLTVHVRTLTVGGVQKPRGNYTFGGGTLSVSHPCGFMLSVR